MKRFRSSRSKLESVESERLDKIAEDLRRQKEKREKKRQEKNASGFAAVLIKAQGK